MAPAPRSQLVALRERALGEIAPGRNLEFKGIVPNLFEQARRDPRLERDIIRLQKERNAIILCHNYQMPEIYEIADFIGDSFGLSRMAQQADAEVIVFCGVHFMAESAAILNPDKRVLLPVLYAGCGMADMISAEGLRELKSEHPDAAVVCYVNSSADVKAESDICCTSSNVVQVVRSLREKKVIMVPDKNLAAYAQRMVPEKTLIAWEGWCPIHHGLATGELDSIKQQYPGAEIIAHPECQADMLGKADMVTSTSGMLTHARSSPAKEFIIVTECGMSNMLRREMPGKKFIPVCQICPDMKKIDLFSVKRSLEQMQFEITVPRRVAERARLALERMMAIAP